MGVWLKSPETLQATLAKLGLPRGFSVAGIHVENRIGRAEAPIERGRRVTRVELHVDPDAVPPRRRNNLVRLHNELVNLAIDQADWPLLATRLLRRFEKADIEPAADSRWRPHNIWSRRRRFGLAT